MAAQNISTSIIAVLIKGFEMTEKCHEVQRRRCSAVMSARKRRRTCDETRQRQPGNVSGFSAATAVVDCQCFLHATHAALTRYSLCTGTATAPPSRATGMSDIFSRLVRKPEAPAEAAVATASFAITFNNDSAPLQPAATASSIESRLVRRADVADEEDFWSGSRNSLGSRLVRKPREFSRSRSRSPGAGRYE
jgi:hypothetical protein